VTTAARCARVNFASPQQQRCGCRVGRAALCLSQLPPARRARTHTQRRTEDALRRRGRQGLLTEEEAPAAAPAAPAVQDDASSAAAASLDVALGALRDSDGALDSAALDAAVCAAARALLASEEARRACVLACAGA
jgi:hypothetical protein